MKSSTLTPVQVSEILLTVRSAATAAYLPVGISADRTLIYGAKVGALTTLGQTADGGATWTDVRTITGGGANITAVMETDDGELLLTTQGGSSTPGYLFKSSGWATSHTTATFTLVLTSIGGWFDGRWVLHSTSFGNDTLVAGTGKYGTISEYGGQTTVTYASGNSNTTDLTKARRVWFTSDYGATWTLIFDVAAYFPTATGLHIHSVAYDPFRDRIWITWGDTQTNTVGAGNMELIYSDDRGATWTPAPAITSGDGAQSTAVTVLPDCIVLGGDNRPGLLRIPVTGYRQIGQPQYPVIVATGTGPQMIANNVHRNRKQLGAPMLMSFQGVSSALYPLVYISPDGGLTFTELYRDPSQPGGVAERVYGPDLAGRIVFCTGPGGSQKLIQATLEDPGPGLLSRRLDLTGDGTTTVFNIAHRLGYAPKQIYPFDQRGNAGTYTVTADATNLIVTFTAAPANAVLVSIDLRYA